jgi:protein SCO1/2
VFDPPRQAPDFTLQGSNGQVLKVSSYRGKVVLLAFGFTSCADVCPTTLATFADTRRKLGAAASEVQVVYVTVDPERDVPDRMKKYLAGFDATFVGGTGSAAQLAAVRKDYGVSAEKKTFGSAYTYAHSSFVYLIDRGGRIRALMPYGHSPDDYVHDLKILLGE